MAGSDVFVKAALIAQITNLHTALEKGGLFS
jgi:hypothetical protein